MLKEEMLLACEGGAGACVRVTVQARVMGESPGREPPAPRRSLAAGLSALIPEVPERGILARLRALKLLGGCLPLLLQPACP